MWTHYLYPFLLSYFSLSPCLQHQHFPASTTCNKLILIRIILIDSEKANQTFAILQYLSKKFLAVVIWGIYVIYIMFNTLIIYYSEVLWLTGILWSQANLGLFPETPYIVLALWSWASYLSTLYLFPLM